MAKKKHNLKQPVFVASQCLDYAKESMFKFNMRYKQAMSAVGAEARGIRTDTDCVGYFVVSDDPWFDPYTVCRGMQQEDPIFDCSELSEDDPMFETTFCKTRNFFGDETAGELVLQANVLKSKLYSYLMLNLQSKKKGKGTPKATVVMCSTHWDYTACVLGSSIESQNQSAEYTKFCKHKQQVYTMNMKRTTLSNVYTTRFCLDSVNLLPFGFDPAWLKPVQQGPEVAERLLSSEEVPTTRKRQRSPESEFLHAAKGPCTDSN